MINGLLATDQIIELAAHVQVRVARQPATTTQISSTTNSLPSGWIARRQFFRIRLLISDKKWHNQKSKGYDQRDGNEDDERKIILEQVIHGSPVPRA